LQHAHVIIEVVFCKIVVLSDHFTDYLQSAKSDVNDGFEQHMQKAIAVKMAGKYKAEWVRYHEKEVKRLQHMEDSLKKAQNIYDAKISLARRADV